MIAPSPETGWTAFARLQHSLERKRTCTESWACEEALTNLLDDFASGIPSPQELKRRFQSLVLNRSRKHRNRARLDERHCATNGPSTNRNGEPIESTASRDRRIVMEASELAARRELVSFVRSAVQADDWRSMWRLACGDEYVLVARGRGITAGQLRTRICRLRAVLRKQIAA